MTTRQRTMVWGTLLALALLGVAVMPVAWAMPAQQLGTVPTRTPTPGSVTNTPVPPPPTSAPVEPTATEEPTETSTVPAVATTGPARTATRVHPMSTETATPTATMSASLTASTKVTPTASGIGVGGPVAPLDDVALGTPVVDSTQQHPTSVPEERAEALPTSSALAPVAVTETTRPASWTLVAGAVLLALGGAALLVNRRRFS